MIVQVEENFQKTKKIKIINPFKEKVKSTIKLSREEFFNKNN